MDNQLEHFFQLKGESEIGATGPVNAVSTREDDIDKVAALVFDCDNKVFRGEFDGRMLDYAVKLIPELQMRKTSAEGNYHAVLRFAQPIPVKRAKSIYKLIAPLLFTDPAANWMTKARVPGTTKQKPGQDPFTITLEREGQPVDPSVLMKRLGEPCFGLCGGLQAFNALVATLAAPDGNPYNDGQESKGVCPLHGSGANPTQCQYRPGLGCCECYGDCKENGSVRGRRITAIDLIREKVLLPEAFSAMYRQASSKPTVMLSNQSPRDEILNQITEHLAASGRFYVHGEAVMQECGGTLYPVVSGKSMSNLVSEAMYVMTPIRDDSYTHTKLSNDDADWLIQSPAHRQMLPQVQLITSVPVLEENLTFTKPGYNTDSQVFYTGQTIPAADNTAHLTKLLEAMYFEREVDRVNFLGMMLSQLLGRRFMGERPMAVLRGNQPGIGKTTAAKVIGILASAEGHIQSLNFNRNDEEFEKQLATVVQRGNLILIDNVRADARDTISSPCLERTVSDRRYNFRRLGSNTSISGDNCLQFLLTCNGGQMSSDLASRSVYIHMRYNGDPNDMPEATIGDLVAYAQEHRVQIIGEMMGLVQTWVDAGAAHAAVSCRFKKWAAMLNGILKANGFEGFLSTLASDRDSGDQTQSELSELAAARPGVSMKPSQWVSEAERLGLFVDRFGGKSERSKSTILGNVLGSAVGRVIEVEDADHGTRRKYELKITTDSDGKLYGFMDVDPSSHVDPPEAPEDPEASKSEKSEEPAEPAEPQFRGSARGSAPFGREKHRRNEDGRNLRNVNGSPQYRSDDSPVSIDSGGRSEVPQVPRVPRIPVERSKLAHSLTQLQASHGRSGGSQ